MSKAPRLERPHCTQVTDGIEIGRHDWWVPADMPSSRLGSLAVGFFDGVSKAFHTLMHRDPQAISSRNRVLNCLSAVSLGNCPNSFALADGRRGQYGRAIMGCTGLKAGTVYPILRSLEDSGEVVAEWDDPTSDARGRLYVMSGTPEIKEVPVHVRAGGAVAVESATLA